MNMNTILAYKDKIGDANIYDKLDTNITSNPNQNNKFIILTLPNIKSKTMPSKTVKLQKHKHKISKWITGGIIRSIKALLHFKALHHLKENTEELRRIWHIKNKSTNI